MTQKQFMIREASAQEIDILARLRIDFLKELKLIHCDVEAEQLFDKILVYFQEKMPKKEVMIWLMEHDKKIICTGAVTIFHGPPLNAKLTGDEAYIHSIYTIPEFRKQGLGTQMTQHIIDALKKKKIPYTWLRTSAQGRSIYENLGFVSQPKTMDMLLIDAKLCD